jgi:hypothetical protein
MRTGMAVLALFACAAPGTAAAQSAQRFSVQGSALYANLLGNAYAKLNNGVGAEAQLRYTPGALSVGGGLQWTHHTTTIGTAPMSLYGFFVEPRYVIATRSNTLAPYLSLRLSVLKQRISDAQFLGTATGLTDNVGAGVLFRLGSRMNFDLGGSFGYTIFSSLVLKDKTNGTSTTGVAGTGSNLILRAGLAVGI